MFLVAVDGEVDEVAGVDLVVLEDGIFVQKDLWAFLLSVEIDGVETLW